MITFRCSLRIRSASGGMTLVEVMISMMVMLVAVGGTLGTISGHLMLGDSARETALAYQEAQRVVETMKAENFGEVFARYNDPTGDDPDASSAGAHFEVPGLTPWKTDADGRVGRILFPVDTGAPGVLREDIEFNGRSLDLDADGSSDAQDHSDDYAVLPVRIRVEWKGRSGNRFVELQTLLTSP